MRNLMKSKYRIVRQSSWGWPWPKPIKVAGPEMFKTFASARAPNTHANILYYWPVVFMALASPCGHWCVASILVLTRQRSAMLRVLE